MQLRHTLSTPLWGVAIKLSIR